MITSKDYQDAIQIQDACNLSGVIHSFSEVLSKLWEEARRGGQGTYFVNQHPISQLYADKITDLARVRDISSYMVAYRECESKAK